MNQIFLTIIIIAILLVVLYFIYRKNFKILKVPSVCLITGGVKTGKSLLSVHLSIKDFKRRHRKWWWAVHLFKKTQVQYDKQGHVKMDEHGNVVFIPLEEPLFYTNVTISFKNIDYKLGIKDRKPHKLDRCIVQVTKNHLLRLKRFNYKSVIYIQESSLMADSMDFNDKKRNVELSLLNKLIAHETRGGALYYDTQSPLDNHYSQKRVCSTYFFIQKNINFLLFHILYIREMINTENGVNNFTDDVDTTTRKVLIPFWYHHKYDRYEYSYLTDCLETENDSVHIHGGLQSFNPLYMELGDKRNLKKEGKKS